MHFGPEPFERFSRQPAVFSTLLFRHNGSQCRDLRTGAMCLVYLAFVTLTEGERERNIIETLPLLLLLIIIIVAMCVKQHSVSAIQ